MIYPNEKNRLYNMCGASIHLLEEIWKMIEKAGNPPLVSWLDIPQIIEIAEKESCVIVGRNADYILREFDHCLRVFVHADRNWRLLHMRKLMPDTPFDQLEADMDKADRARKNYCVKHTGRVYGDSRNYDLTLCTSKLGIDKALEILLCAAKDI